MADGDDVQTTGVEADTGAEDASATDTTTVAADDTNSDASADTASADDTTDAGDSGQSDTDGEAGAEGSQTPPDAYADFVMPEGVQIDESMLTEATPLFKELGLTQDQAQKLVDFQATQVQAGAQKQVDAFNQQKTDWRDQSASDKEFGGDAFEENIKVAQSAINNFGTPELKQLLEDYGVGNHPEVIRFMVKVGKLTAEDVPGGSSNPLQSTQNRVNQLYPNDRNE
jgi:hypothetical protein